MLSAQAANTNIIVFDLTRSGLEPSIYSTRGEHANQYSTDAVHSRTQYDKVILIFEWTKRNVAAVFIKPSIKKKNQLIVFKFI